MEAVNESARRRQQHSPTSNPAIPNYTGGGLRDFFLYRDLGIATATGGQVICHLVKANPECRRKTAPAGIRHECEFQIVIMTKGWARFMYEDKPTLVQAGDVVHQRPGITHYLYDYSPDMEYLEIVSPADFKTVDMPPATDKVPPVTPWNRDRHVIPGGINLCRRPLAAAASSSCWMWCAGWTGGRYLAVNNGVRRSIS